MNGLDVEIVCSTSTIPLPLAATAAHEAYKVPISLRIAFIDSLIAFNLFSTSPGGVWRVSNASRTRFTSSPSADSYVNLTSFSSRPFFTI